MDIYNTPVSEGEIKSVFEREAPFSIISAQIVPVRMGTEIHNLMFSIAPFFRLSTFPA